MNSRAASAVSTSFDGDILFASLRRYPRVQLLTTNIHRFFFFSLSSPSISPRSGKLKITPAFKGKISRQGHNEIYLNTCNYCIRFYDDKFQDYSSARTLTRLEATAPPLMQTAHIQLGPLASVFFYHYYLSQLAIASSLLTQKIL